MLLGKPVQSASDLQSLYNALPLFTYRHAFSPLPSTTQHITSDQGWGCLLRTGQMLLATFLTHSSLRNVLPSDIVLEMFRDLPGSHASFSIHNFIRAAGVERRSISDGSNITQWWNPTLCAAVLQRLVSEHSLVSQSCAVEVGDACTIFGGDVDAHFASSPAVSKSVLVLVPTRAGMGSTVDPSYASSIQHILQCPQSLGILGGVPAKSYYFVGLSPSHKVVYLDPHIITQPAYVSESTQGFLHPSQQYHETPITSMDASLLAAFMIQSKEDWASLQAYLSDATHKQTLVTVTPGTKASLFADIDDCEWIEPEDHDVLPKNNDVKLDSADSITITSTADFVLVAKKDK
eukprot:PhF_6_TR26441/c1_g1_i3/m.38293/K08342/ATG4; cysteine protease ATG4